ncbi:MAG: hypothetical protein K5868_04825 [Lachnospiraceae bacterium]|nr:hypothetical protein [Lachnospiraceae bacterium]
MMRFHKEMYVAPSVKNVLKTRWKLRTGRGSLNIYVIVLNHDSKKVEYFHNGMLKQRILHNRDLYIVGLARSGQECMELIERMMQDAYEATGEYDIYKYMKD